MRSHTQQTHTHNTGTGSYALAQFFRMLVCYIEIKFSLLLNTRTSTTSFICVLIHFVFPHTNTHTVYQLIIYYIRSIILVETQLCLCRRFTFFYSLLFSNESRYKLIFR